MLSVCIPTYKRRRTLLELFRSLADQDLSEVEICISDNASNDGTRELVAEWGPKLGRVVYHEWPDNVGYDRNLLKVVDLATQEYCWLLGSDDLVAPGGVARLIVDLRVCKPQGLLIGYLGFKAQPPADLQSLPVSADGVVVVRGQRLIRTAPDFGFLSRQIFRKDLVAPALADGLWQNCIGGGYIHFYLLMKIAFQSQNPVWYRDDSPILLYRAGSFADQVAGFGSVHKRLLNEILEVIRVFELSCKPETATAILTYGAWRDLTRNLAAWRLSNPSPEFVREMRAALHKLPLRSRFDIWTMLFVTFLPPFFIKAVRSVVRMVNKVRYIWASRGHLLRPQRGAAG